MHSTVMEFVRSALSQDEVEGQLVVEAGSLNVNGSVREFVKSLKPSQYLGTDMRAGPDVDVACLAEDLPKVLKTEAGVVISTEMMEHVENWQAAMSGLIRLLKPGGCLVITTRSDGMPIHSYPDDFWRFSVEVMEEILESAGLRIELIESDRLLPGVFAKALKPVNWQWNGIPEAWHGVDVIVANDGKWAVNDEDLTRVHFKFDCASPAIPGQPFILYRNNEDGTRTQIAA